MSDDSIPRPSRLDAVRRALRYQIIPARRPTASPAVRSRIKLRQRIDEAPLPEPAKELVHRVVRRTRLWKREKADVAEELIAHFTDGLAAGETGDALVEAFGDERRAAKLIRRAKRRNRPLAWHAMRGLRLMIGGLVVLYAGLAVYFHLGRPSPKVDYVAILNEPIGQIPEDQRAWPLYREALMGMSARGGDAPDAFQELAAARPGDERWPQTAEWLADHREPLELARRAAERPTLGFVIGPGGSAEDTALWPGQTANVSISGRTSNDGLLIAVLLPHLLELRTVANALGADAAFARQAGDREQWARDVAAIRGIARQLTRDGFLVNQLVGLGVSILALEEIHQALSGAPQMFRDDDLRRLAHGLAGPDVAADLLDLRAERMIFRDLVQRAYTDDGDGRLTPDGLRLLTDVTALPRLGDDFHDPVTLAGGPASLVLVAPRAELSRVYDRFMDARARAVHAGRGGRRDSCVGNRVGAVRAGARAAPGAAQLAASR